jgi:hypothetical protein
MSVFRLFREIVSEMRSKKLMPVEATAKKEGFPIVLVVERGSLIHGHATNRVVDYSFQFVHGRVVVTPV